MDIDTFQEHLRTIFPLANAKDKNDVLFVALYVLMLEMDFVPHGSTYDQRFLSFPQDSVKNGVHSIDFYHLHFPHVSCRMVAVSLGQSMVVHGMLLNQDENRAMSLKVDDYVNFRLNTKVEDIFRHAPQLSLKFKDGFIIPLLSDVYESSGIQPAFSFKNLSADLKYHVLSYLPAKSLVAMAKVNKEFYGLANFDLLWKDLYKRDFPDALPESIEQQHNWKNLYKEEYLRQEKERAKRNAQRNPYYGPFWEDRDRSRFLPPPPPFFPGRNPVLPMLAPAIQDAFPHLRDRYTVENPILRQMILRNPFCTPNFRFMDI